MTQASNPGAQGFPIAEASKQFLGQIGTRPVVKAVQLATAILAARQIELASLRDVMQAQSADKTAANTLP